MSSIVNNSSLEIQHVAHRTPSIGSLVSGCHLKSDGIEYPSSIKVNEIFHQDQLRSRSRSPRRAKKSASCRDLKSSPRQPNASKVADAVPHLFTDNHSMVSIARVKSMRTSCQLTGNVSSAAIHSQQTKLDRNLPLLCGIPIEVQSLILTHLPYRSLLALRLTSHHFSDRLIPLSILTNLRRQLSRTYILTERATLNTILQVPGVRSRFNRFWYQDPFYLSYLLWKLEQGGSNESLECFKSMENLRCYTCLELKGAFNGDFSRKFSTRSRGLGGTRAETRMCKECMVRKTIHGLYGKWWKEGYWRDRDVVRLRKHSGVLSAHKLKDSITKKSKSDQPAIITEEEHGVCATCRKECYSLYWGCAACFEKEQARLQRIDLLNCLSKRSEHKYKLNVRKEELKQRWYRYSGMSGNVPYRGMSDSSSPLIRAFSRVLDVFCVSRLKNIKNLVGGRDYWLYRDWKKRMREYEKEDREKEAKRNAESASNDNPLASSSYTGASDFTAWCVRQYELRANAAAATLDSNANTSVATPADAEPFHPTTELQLESSSEEVWSPYAMHAEICPSPASATWANPSLDCRWEIRCSECWRYNRPSHWYVSATYDQLPFERLCTQCQNAVVAGKARRSRRDEWKKKQNRLFVLYGNTTTDAAALCGRGAGAGPSTVATCQHSQDSEAQQESEETEMPPPVLDAVANAVMWQTISRLFAEAGYD